jgi:membrane-associated phospholipid phosphatase
MPSLHAGWDLLVGLSISLTAASLWLRWIGRVLPVLMAIAVVVTGNHYIVDVIAGVALALVGLAAAHARRRCRERRTLDGRSRPVLIPVAGRDLQRPLVRR